MKIIDHGTWEGYTPDVRPKDHPDSVIYARRQKDKRDWYDYQITEFKKGSIVAMILHNADHYVVLYATHDPSEIFPGHQAGTRIIEITGTTIHPKDLIRRVYDPANNTLTEEKFELFGKPNGNSN